MVVLWKFALVNLVWDSKAAQINMQENLVRELMLSKFEQSLNAVLQTKTFIKRNARTLLFMEDQQDG